MDADEPHTTPPPADHAVLLLGDGDIARAVASALGRQGVSVDWVRRPDDAELSRHIGRHADTVLVVTRDDIEAFRLALLVEHARPGRDLIVTIFDRTIAQQLRDAAPGCRVVSMAELVASTLAGPCVAPGVLSVIDGRDGPLAMRRDGDGFRLEPLDPRPERFGGWLRTRWPVDSSARFLLAGILGFLSILAADTLIGIGVLHEQPIAAFYAAVKALLTVGPNPAVDHGPAWVRVVEPLLMLATFGFAAILTAGIVTRLSERRLTAIAGPRSVPRRHHVVVVGFGQMGLRMAMRLRELGVPVVAVERNAGSPYLERARRAGIPVLVADGVDRALLQQLSLRGARALAAVTSDDLSNVAIAVAGLAVAPDLRVVLRAGDGDVTAETRSLFHVGVVRDIHRIVGDVLAATALGVAFEAVADADGTTWLVDDVDGAPAFRAFQPSA
ncbi:MAG: NAD-binding protein [Thermoleophilia bacterium]|nr:NAD-binding protein [Thermoleophilia bacterium]